METEIKFCPRCGAEIAHLTSGYVCLKCGWGEGGSNDVVEIPFGAHDSELQHWEYTIPEGYEARIEGNKVVLEPKESEDERTRKSLLAYIKGESKRLDTKKWIAYLEKQKERKPAQYDIDILEKHITKDSISELAHTVIIRNGWEIVEKEQKPAEWSGEDGIRKNAIANWLAAQGYVKYSGFYAFQLIDWLNSLPERFNLQPNLEWSEEDVEKLAKNRMSKSGTLRNEMFFYRQGVRDAFNYKGFRPVWKPSEGQMQALYAAIELSGQPVTLQSLYNDLKKLK